MVVLLNFFFYLPDTIVFVFVFEFIRFLIEIANELQKYNLVTNNFEGDARIKNFNCLAKD